MQKFSAGGLIMALFYRWTGIALVLGAILSVLGQVVGGFLYASNDVSAYLTTGWSLWQLMAFLGEALMVFGLFGIAYHQHSNSGALGFWGFVFTFFGGFLLTAVTGGFYLFAPWIAQGAPKLLAGDTMPSTLFTYFMVAGIVFALGGILLGWSVWRAGVFNKWAGLALLLGGLLNFVGNIFLQGMFSTVVNDVAFVLFAGALAWMGYSLLRAKVSVQA